jgi:hypothetical protein
MRARCRLYDPAACGERDKKDPACGKSLNVSLFGFDRERRVKHGIHASLNDRIQDVDDPAGIRRAAGRITKSIERSSVVTPGQVENHAPAGQAPELRRQAFFSQ